MPFHSETRRLIEIALAGRSKKGKEGQQIGRQLRCDPMLAGLTPAARQTYQAA
jgi:hypothetical protein